MELVWQVKGRGGALALGAQMAVRLYNNNKFVGELKGKGDRAATRVMIFLENKYVVVDPSAWEYWQQHECEVWCDCCNVGEDLGDLGRGRVDTTSRSTDGRRRLWSGEGK